MYYLTPDRLKTMKTGTNFTGISDLELAEVIADATAIVNAYCSVPYGFSFLGGLAVGEQLQWHYPTTYYDQGSRRVYPKNTPIIEVTSFRLVVGSDASASLPVGTLVINNQERWVEVTAASIANSSGLFGVSGWIVPFGGLKQPIAELDYSYGSTTEADDRLWPISDGSLIYQAPNGFWAAAPDPVISDAGVDLALNTGYTVSLEEGRVTFASAPTGPVRAVYSFRLPREIVSATAMIVTDLLGASKLVAKDMTGLSRITNSEITIQRETGRQQSTGKLSAGLETAVPQAAQLLDGYKFWSMARAGSV